jgi:hypothetical protein
MTDCVSDRWSCDVVSLTYLARACLVARQAELRARAPSTSVQCGAFSAVGGFTLANVCVRTTGTHEFLSVHARVDHNRAANLCVLRVCVCACVL